MGESRYNKVYMEVHTHFDELIELMDENTIDTPITSSSRRSDNFDSVTDGGVCSIIPCGYMYNHPSQYIYNSLNNPYIVDLYHSYVYMIDCF